MNVGRLYFESDVLPNGDVFVAGGEYTVVDGSQQETETNTAEMYVPGPGQNYLHGTWEVLPSNPQPEEAMCRAKCYRMATSSLATTVTRAPRSSDPTTNTWSRRHQDPGQRGQQRRALGQAAQRRDPAYDLWASIEDNEGLAEIYNPTTNAWSDASNGNLPVLSSPGNEYELGPEILMPNGNCSWEGPTASPRFTTRRPTPGRKAPRCRAS